MYKPKARVSHPLYGLGTVESIETKEVLDHRCDYAVVFFPEEGLRMMVRADGENELIRPVVKPERVKEVLTSLRDFSGEGPARANWRQRVNLAKLKSNDIFQTAEVVKNLFLVKQRRRKLNAKEEAMFERAWRVLLDELELASGSSREDLSLKLEEACGAIPSERAAG